MAPPRFTREWAANNSARFQELLTPPEECCICYATSTPDNGLIGPIQGDVPTGCRHYACETCWASMTADPLPWSCPQCRQDVTAWLFDVFAVEAPEDSVDIADIAVFVEGALEIFQARGLASELQEIGQQILRHLPKRAVDQNSVYTE